MPTPIGHALGGFAAGWLLGAKAGPARGTFLRVALFAAVGMAPDLDLLVGRHHQFTHSFGAALVVFALALLVLRRRRDALVLAVALAAAYASHPLLDWLGEDSTPPRGIMALWPLSHAYYISHADFFRSVSRELWRPGVVWHDLAAVAGEIVFLAPLAVGAWLVRRPAVTGRAKRHLPPLHQGRAALSSAPGDAVPPAAAASSCCGAECRQNLPVSPGSDEQRLRSPAACDNGGESHASK